MEVTSSTAAVATRAPGGASGPMRETLGDRVPCCATSSLLLTIESGGRQAFAVNRSTVTQGADDPACDQIGRLTPVQA
jgi:hypothetical protein